MKLIAPRVAFTIFCVVFAIISGLPLFMSGDPFSFALLFKPISPILLVYLGYIIGHDSGVESTRGNQ